MHRKGMSFGPMKGTWFKNRPRTKPTHAPQIGCSYLSSEINRTRPASRPAVII